MGGCCDFTAGPGPGGVGKRDCAGTACLGKLEGAPAAAGFGANLGPVAMGDGVYLGADMTGGAGAGAGGAGGVTGCCADGKSLRCFKATHGGGTGAVSSCGLGT